MTSRLVLVTLCALFAFSSALDVAFTVAKEHKACQTVADCSLIANQCCSGANCGYDIVNRTMFAQYDAIRQTYVSNVCSTVLCAAVVCDPLPLECAPVAGTSGGVCQFISNVKPTPCPEGVETVNCLVDPCSTATCDAFPNAQCVSNYCGGCNANFFIDGKQVDCSIKGGDGLCLDGSKPVNCLTDPCSTAVCPANPKAQCTANYCGGCNAVFSVEGKPIDCNDVTDPQLCPDGSRPIQCFADPCSNAKCSVEGAVCKSNYCGGCNAEWFVGERKVTCEAPNPCPDGVAQSHCLVDPCSVAKCDAHPDATCDADYCGGCTAVFRVKGEVVSCPKPDPEPLPCPAGVPQHQCLVDPCSVATCGAYPHAECRADYCGGCRAVFTVENRIVNCDATCLGLSCGDCLKKEYCSYCSGSFSTGERSDSLQEFGYCVASNSYSTERCNAISSSTRVINSDVVCPSAPASNVSDHSPIQNEVTSSGNPILLKFVVVITLLVNESKATDDLNIVRMFVDLVGSSTPSSDEKEQLCTVLKNALAKVDSRVPAALDKLTCSLSEKASVKRDVSFVADLAFPGMSQQGAASALVVSMASVALGLVAALAA